MKNGVSHLNPNGSAIIIWSLDATKVFEKLRKAAQASGRTKSAMSDYTTTVLFIYYAVCIYSLEQFCIYLYALLNVLRTQERAVTLVNTYTAVWDMHRMSLCIVGI